MVKAPAAAIWDTLTDLKRYPKFIGGLSSVEQYSTRKTLTGGQLFCARYTLSVGPLYKVKYFVEHRHEPLQKSMVWQLSSTTLTLTLTLTLSLSLSLSLTLTLSRGASWLARTARTARGGWARRSHASGSSCSIHSW